MSLFRAQPWTRQPGDGARINWAHPIFLGATKALVFNGLGVISYRKDGPGRIISASSGSWARTPAYGHMAVQTTGSDLIILDQTLQSLTSVLAIGYFRSFKTGSSNYINYRYAAPGGVSFGGGLGAASGDRSDWSWTQNDVGAPYCVVPNSSMALAPAVYLSGRQVSVSSAGGTCTNYNWGDSTTYFGPGYAFGTVPAVLLVAVNWQIPAAVAAEATRNTWQLFAPQRQLMLAPSAAVFPTLSAATYMPGSLTSTGFRPRVTAA